MQKIHAQLVQQLKNYFLASGLSSTVLGMSGGIDSALTLKLAVDALGAEKVTAISMPQTGLSDPTHIRDAQSFCKELGVNLLTVPLNSLLTSFENLPWKASAPAQQNLKARLRMVLLYHYANSHNALVLGTSNRSEILLGYGTKFGDFAADIEVIGALYKDEVYALAKYLQLPQTFIEKAPTAELFPGQTDENEIGASYVEMDPILKELDLEKPDLGIHNLPQKDFDQKLVEKILNRVQKNRHKSEPAPILNITREKI